MEFVPFAKFTKLWLYKKVLIDSVAVDSIYNELLTKYPDNKYTYAAEQFLAGKDSIVITTKKYINETLEYSNAIDSLETQPKQTIKLLIPIADDIDHEYRYKALYGLGYINYFLLADSLSAKPYFDSVLAYPENSEFKTEVTKFYDGESFIKISRLPFIEQMIQKELDEEISEQEQEDKEDSKEPEKPTEMKNDEPENVSPVKGKE